jgi:hypothetical protein
MARELYTVASKDIAAAAATSRNGARLRSIPELRDDVPFCTQRDLFNFPAAMQKDGKIKRI